MSDISTQNMKNFVFMYLIIIRNCYLCIHADNFGVNSQIELMNDMSLLCIDDLDTNLYLTFGMGVSDAVIILISDNDLYPNCELTFCTVGASNSVYLILVIEFPDHTEGPKNACQDTNSNIYIEDPSQNREINVCDEVNKMSFGYYSTPVFTIITESSNLTAKVVCKSLFETVKITATSARKLTQYERCDKFREVSCQIDNFSVCISRELLCDENINCGASGLNDEDVRICDEGRYKRLWLVVLSGTIMILIVVLFLIHLLKACLPAIPDNFFIFNEDEDNKLILSTQFIPPPDSLRQPAPRKLQQQTSAFRFKNVPVNSWSPTAISSDSMKPERLSEKDRLSRHSEELEIELESQIYKQNAKRSSSADTVPVDITKSKKIQSAKQVYGDKQIATKKPRFQRSIINIMDYIDQPSYSEVSDEPEPSARQKEKKGSLRKEALERKKIPTQQSLSKRERGKKPASNDS